MHPCIICLTGEASSWNGGICNDCLPPLRPYKSRRRVRIEISVYPAGTLPDRRAQQ